MLSPAWPAQPRPAPCHCSLPAPPQRFAPAVQQSVSTELRHRQSVQSLHVAVTHCVPLSSTALLIIQANALHHQVSWLDSYTHSRRRDAHLLGCMPFSRSLCSCQLLQTALQRRRREGCLECSAYSRDCKKLPTGRQLHRCPLLAGCGMRQDPALICAQVKTTVWLPSAALLAARPACENQDEA